MPIEALTEDYYTVSYSPSVGAWQSFWSFEPEAIVGMNGLMYTVKNGNLWRHDTGSLYSQFYGSTVASKISGVFNQDPSSVKVFKTFNIEGNAPWDVTFESNLSGGEIEVSWFEQKEGEFFAYIRRVDQDGNYNLRSVQGIGLVDAVVGTNVSFAFDVGSNISVGDSLFKSPVGVGSAAPSLVGTISAINGGVLDITSVDSPLNVSAGDYVMAVKRSVAESYGNSGYYMRFDMEVTSNSFVEMFAVGTDIFKSYP